MSAIFNFQSLLTVILLLSCTCAYLRAMAPSLLDKNKTGLLGIFWKCARIGERKSPYVAVCCVIMTLSILFSNYPPCPALHTGIPSGGIKKTESFRRSSSSISTLTEEACMGHSCVSLRWGAAGVAVNGLLYHIGTHSGEKHKPPSLPPSFSWWPFHSLASISC